MKTKIGLTLGTLVLLTSLNNCGKNNRNAFETLSPEMKLSQENQDANSENGDFATDIQPSDSNTGSETQSSEDTTDSACTTDFENDQSCN